MSDILEISVEKFKRRLDLNQVQFILDLRNEDEFDSWKIEGVNPVETVNIPQVDFVGEEDKYLDRLPKDKEIVIACAHGDASKYSAEVLQDKGYKALGLIGGMDAWSVLYETSLTGEDPQIYQTYRIAKGCITSIVISDGEAVVIDAVRHIDQIRDLVAKHQARIKYVFDTHLQADHISGGRELARSVGCDYCLNKADMADAAYDFRDLADGAVFEFGKCEIVALHSPGHTPGSTSLILDGKFLFSGDAIMKTTVGRPDLGGMVEVWAELLYNTLHTRFSSLKDEMIILPSHAASVMERDENGIVSLTMDEARQKLELFNIKDPGKFLDYVKSTLLENPVRYQSIRQVNLGILQKDEAGMRELEIGKNLCGMDGKTC